MSKQLRQYDINRRETVKHNPVAKYARRFNRAQTHTDRRKADRRGYRKHKQQWR